jgi:hypothetical protein
MRIRNLHDLMNGENGEKVKCTIHIVLYILPQRVKSPPSSTGLLVKLRPWVDENTEININFKGWGLETEDHIPRVICRYAVRVVPHIYHFLPSFNILILINTVLPFNLSTCITCANSHAILATSTFLAHLSMRVGPGPVICYFKWRPVRRPSK